MISSFFRRSLLPLAALSWGLLACTAAPSQTAETPLAEAADAIDPDLPERTLVTVFNPQQLKAALQDVQAGTTIQIAPGNFSGFHLANAHGTSARPIVITAADTARSPVFTSRNESVKLSSCSYVKIAGLTVRGCGGNGINIADDGRDNLPSHHIRLESLEILETGLQGNNDSLKMSGVDHFVVRDCHFERWGGSGIDLVGCHLGIIERCHFVGREGDRTKNAVQIKGGSSEILVQSCYFENAGERSINIGGSTALPSFRPSNATYETRNVVIAGNRFVGAEAQIAWVTAQHTHVHHNLFYFPTKYVGRILQETKDRRFQPCQLGLFENNLAVTDQRVRVEVNASRGTDPATFAFQRNAWWRQGESKKPSLPTTEIEAIHGVDPQLEFAGTTTMFIGSTDPQLMSVGPEAYKAWPSPGDFSDVTVPGAKWSPPPATSTFQPKYLIYGLLAVLAAVMAIMRWKEIAPDKWKEILQSKWKGIVHYMKS